MTTHQINKRPSPPPVARPDHVQLAFDAVRLLIDRAFPLPLTPRGKHAEALLDVMDLELTMPEHDPLVIIADAEAAISDVPVVCHVVRQEGDCAHDGCVEARELRVVALSALSALRVALLMPPPRAKPRRRRKAKTPRMQAAA